MPPEPHPAIAPLAFLLGTWVGEGRGEYPTIDPFAYEITVTFGHVGKPFLTYGHTSRAADDGRPLHAESGFWRVLDPDPADPATTLARLEVVIAQPTGVAEILLGSAVQAGEGVHIALGCDDVLRSSTAKEVGALRWELAWDGAATVRESFAMEAVGEPLTHHLSARLRRT